MVPWSGCSPGASFRLPFVMKLMIYIYIMMKCMYVCHMFAYFLSEGRHVHSDDDDENGHDNYDKD